MTNSVVDKVAEAMFNSTHGFPSWGEIGETDRDLYRALAQAAIETVLWPFAQWLRDAGYLTEPYVQDDTAVSGNPQALVARWLEVEPRKERNTYVKLNALSDVYRVAELRGGKAHLVPAPERADGARRDRGWFDISSLIPCPDDVVTPPAMVGDGYKQDEPERQE